MDNTETNNIFDSRNLSTKYGILAGVGMSLILLLFQATANDFSPWLKLVKYFILGIVLIFALNKLSSISSKDVFIKSISAGTKLSLIAALVLVVINILLFIAIPNLAFSKYNIEPANFSQVSMVSAVLFFETLVFGSIISFAIAQFLKK